MQPISFEAFKKKKEKTAAAAPTPVAPPQPAPISLAAANSPGKGNQPVSYLDTYNWFVRKTILDIMSNIALYGIQDENQQVYFDFFTQYPGVSVPPDIKARFPQVCRLILQHQFEGLKVHQDSFEVTLWFNNRQWACRFPVESLLGIMDPSVGFGIGVVVEQAAIPAAPQDPSMSPEESSDV